MFLRAFASLAAAITAVQLILAPAAFAQHHEQVHLAHHVSEIPYLCLNNGQTLNAQFVTVDHSLQLLVTSPEVVINLDSFVGAFFDGAQGLFPTFNLVVRTVSNDNPVVLQSTGFLVSFKNPDGSNGSAMISFSKFELISIDATTGALHLRFDGHQLFQPGTEILAVEIFDLPSQQVAYKQFISNVLIDGVSCVPITHHVLHSCNLVPFGKR